jgi:predicted DNA-binding protein
MKKSIQTAKLQLWIDEKVHKKLRSIATEQGRTVAELVREGIVKIVREYEDFIKKD